MGKTRAKCYCFIQLGKNYGKMLVLINYHETVNGCYWYQVISILTHKSFNNLDGVDFKIHYGKRRKCW